jgi:hypothetical protein
MKRVIRYTLILAIIFTLSIHTSGLGWFKENKVSEYRSEFITYPHSYIIKTENKDEMIYTFPYCHSQYCKGFMTPNNIRIISRHPFYLNVNIPIHHSIDNTNIHLTNSFYNMEVHLRKKKLKQKQMEPVVNKQSVPLDLDNTNTFYNTEAHAQKKNLKQMEPIVNKQSIPLDFDITEEPVIEDYYKNADAVSGYYNYQNEWVAY